MLIVSKVTREKLYNKNYNRDGLEFIGSTDKNDSKIYLAQLLVKVKQQGVEI